MRKKLNEEEWEMVVQILTDRIAELECLLHLKDVDNQRLKGELRAANMAKDEEEPEF
ncbi:MAG: hypothetical protein IJV67_02475 [Clostridia bacterium]|nr:hypothetical protein [Clostridia bacterium]